MMMTHEQRQHFGRQGGLALRDRLRRDPAFAQRHRELVSRNIKAAWAMRKGNGGAAPVPAVKPNGSNGHVVGRHSGLTKALATVDAQIAQAKDEVKRLEASRHLLEAAQRLVKATIQ